MEAPPKLNLFEVPVLITQIKEYAFVRNKIVILRTALRNSYPDQLKYLYEHSAEVKNRAYTENTDLIIETIIHPDYIESVKHALYASTTSEMGNP